MSYGLRQVQANTCRIAKLSRCIAMDYIPHAIKQVIAISLGSSYINSEFGTGDQNGEHIEWTLYKLILKASKYASLAISKRL